MPPNETAREECGSPSHSRGLQFINLGFSRPWQIVRPRVYRWLESQYVDAFFADGSLRLSTFDQFSKHKDEERKDHTEGHGIQFAEGKDLTVALSTGVGSDCYVMCGSTAMTNSISSSLEQYSACFCIEDLLGFADAVAQQLPFFRGGLDGPVIYMDEKTFNRSLGNQSYDDFIAAHKNADGTLSLDMIPQLMHRLGMEELPFAKSSKYAAQLEYRLLWRTGQEVRGYLDIKAPAAVKFCSRVC